MTTVSQISECLVWLIFPAPHNIFFGIGLYFVSLRAKKAFIPERSRRGSNLKLREAISTKSCDNFISARPTSNRQAEPLPTIKGCKPMLTALYGHSVKNSPGLLYMDYNRTASNRLIDTIIIFYGLNTGFVFFPNFNPESVRVVAGP